MTFGSGVPALQSSCGFISASSAKKFGGDVEHMLPVKEIIKRDIGQKPKVKLYSLEKMPFLILLQFLDEVGAGFFQHENY